MKKIIFITVLTTFFVLTSCDDLLPPSNQEVAMVIAKSVQSIGQSQGNNALLGNSVQSSESKNYSSRSIELSTTVNYPGPNGGSISYVSTIDPDGNLSGNASYNNVKVIYENKEYIINGTITLTLSSESNLDFDSGNIEVPDPILITSSMNTIGVLNVARGTTSSDYSVNLSTVVDMSLSFSSGTSTGTVTSSGTINGVAVPTSTYTYSTSFSH